MAAFRLGLIGAGRMGRTHLRALSSSEHVRIVAAADPSPEACAALGAAGLAVFRDVEALLQAGRLDGVLIAAPSRRHLDLVAQVAAAGLPILCEKPCGLTPAEAREAASVATAAGVTLQVAYWRRFVPALQLLRQRIADGELGGIYFAACFQWDGVPPAREFRAGSGGIFIDMGVHEFDQLRWLTGQELTAIHPAACRIGGEPAIPGDAESAQALCELSGGSTGLVSLGRRHPLGDVCWVQVFGTGGVEECRFLWPPHGEEEFLQALRWQAEGFAMQVRGGTGLGASALDAAAALHAAEQASLVLAASP